MIITMDGHDVGEATHSMQVSEHTSAVARVLEVRRILLRDGSDFAR